MFSLSGPPKHCGPEKLVLCVDTLCRTNDIVKRIKNFLTLKCMVNQHEIGLMFLTKTGVEGPYDFTTNIDNVVSRLTEFTRQRNWNRQADTRESETFNMSLVFTQLLQQWKYPTKDGSLRLIMFYSRVQCMPILETPEALLALQRDPAVTIDILYIPQFTNTDRARQTEPLKAQRVLRELCKFCTSSSYSFATIDPQELTLFTVRLLAHPSVRVSQDHSQCISNCLRLAVKV